MSHPASITHPLVLASEAAKAGTAAHELLPLLKVRMIHASLVALLITFQYWFELASSLSDRPRLLVETFFGLYLANVPDWIIGFAIISVVQDRMAAGRIRTFVLLASVVLWSSLRTLFVPFGLAGTFVVVELGLTTQAGHAMHALWTTTTYMLLAAGYYESADRARRWTAAQRQSELVRRSAERWLLELRLGSLQARLDPQVLFDTLDEVGRLYRARPAAAEQLLDALIHYLRRALPQLRETQSTLEREVALACAYLRVLRTRDGEPLEIEAAVGAAVADARFPRMVVQPLCDALAHAALATSGGPVRMAVSAAREQDCARLHVSAQPVQSAPSQARLADIRHTLLAMFGHPARMDVSGPAAGVLHVVMEVPHDAAPCIDR
jgi:sensor histidine kinase YesM